MAHINFNAVGVKMPDFDVAKVSAWIESVARSFGKSVGDISYIFCDDNKILEVNRTYLKHDYFTDIITFYYCEGSILSGDLFISVDSVKENSLYYGTDPEEELNRVIVHGILHLIGYDDHSTEDIAVMRSKENFYLDMLAKMK